jgi:hypothetical protein
MLVLVFCQYGGVLASDQCRVKLPALCPNSNPQVNAFIHVNELEACSQILDPSNQNYSDVTFNSMPPGSDIVTGTPYRGWCVDLRGSLVQDTAYIVDLYSSLAPPAFLSTLGIPWGSINYLLNNKPLGATWLEVQAAIWTLVNGSIPSNFPLGDAHGCLSPRPLQTVVDVLVAEANAHLDFVPGSGQKYGIILIPLIPETCEPDIHTNPNSRTPKQITLIEAECEPDQCPDFGGEHPYIGIVGNDNGVNPFYLSPKYLQFACEQTLFGVPTSGEQFRSQMPTIQPEICDVNGKGSGPHGIAPPFTFRGRLNSRVTAGNAGWFEWYIRLPKKPLGDINLVFQCGVLKPNTFPDLGFAAVQYCAAETGERIGQEFCDHQFVDPGFDPLVPAALPKITATVSPGPYNSFTPFNLTAYKNPATYQLEFMTDGAITNGPSSQILNGTIATRILLKACMDKTLVVKLPVAGQLNAMGQTEADLVQGDLIYVRMNIPRQNTVDIYCHHESLRVMGMGEGAF